MQLELLLKNCRISFDPSSTAWCKQIRDEVSARTDCRLHRPARTCSVFTEIVATEAESLDLIWNCSSGTRLSRYLNRPTTVPRPYRRCEQFGATKQTGKMGVNEEDVVNIMGGMEHAGGIKLNDHKRKLKNRWATQSKRQLVQELCSSTSFGVLTPANTKAQSRLSFVKSGRITRLHCFRFEICKKLGQGTYGKVQLGVNKESGQQVSSVYSLSQLYRTGRNIKPTDFVALEYFVRRQYRVKNELSSFLCYRCKMHIKPILCYKQSHFERMLVFSKSGWIWQQKGSLSLLKSVWTETAESAAQFLQDCSCSSARLQPNFSRISRFLKAHHLFATKWITSHFLSTDFVRLRVVPTAALRCGKTPECWAADWSLHSVVPPAGIAMHIV